MQLSMTSRALLLVALLCMCIHTTQVAAGGARVEAVSMPSSHSPYQPVLVSEQPSAEHVIEPEYVDTALVEEGAEMGVSLK